MKYLLAAIIAIAPMFSLAEVEAPQEPQLSCYFDGKHIGTMTPQQCFAKGGSVYYVPRSSSSSMY